MEWLIVIILLLALGILYAGYYVFRTVMDTRMHLPFTADDIDDPDNVMYPTARRHYEYRLKHLDNYRSLPFETLTIKSFDGLTLYGNLLKGENSRETVILVHGYKSAPENEFCGISRFYQQRKCNILAVENRGHKRSEGRYVGFSELDQYDIMSWVRKINEIYPDSSIFLHGVSMGAAAVIHTCDKEMENVKGIIEDCGFTSIRAITRSMMKRAFNIPYFPVGYISSFFALILAGVDYDKSDGIKEVGRSKYPILFISGDSDNFVPVSMTMDMYASCSSEKYLLIVEGAGHAAANVVAEDEYFSQIEMFMDKYS
ncbi:MAG TPA: alpha/beta hydrolase [Erysipelotrichaceae bacterium]|nr:alpha/beta hydrolase [Erysipelotrichaceae bacterium]HQB32034.1 alpha/beta hydrolase [Erysipelotrichaceae bacterium]